MTALVRGESRVIAAMRESIFETTSIVQTFGAFGRWVQSRSPALIAGLLIILSLARDGIVVWNWFELSPFLLTDWGGPASAFQSNVLLNGMATAWEALGLDATSFWWQVSQVVLTVMVFAALAFLVLRRTEVSRSYLPLAVILSSGIATVLWREIGRYDTLYILGVAVALLARRQWIVWIGVAVASLSSPEQALTAAILLLLVSGLPFFRDWCVAATRLLIGSVLALLTIQLWFAVLGNPSKTRIGVLVDHLLGREIEAASAYDTSQSFIQFTIEKAMISLSAGIGLVWSYLGSAVFLVFLVALIQRSWMKTIYMVVVVVVLPITIGFTFGEDRTRDMALICAPLILAISMTGSRHLSVIIEMLPGDARTWLAWSALLISLIPFTYYYLDAEEAWRWTKEVIISINNGVPMVNDGSLR